MNRNPTPGIRRSGLAFVRLELRTGLTLSRIARSAARQDKRERNRTNARKAYDAAMLYIGKFELTRTEDAEQKKREHRPGNGQKQ